MSWPTDTLSPRSLTDRTLASEAGNGSSILPEGTLNKKEPVGALWFYYLKNAVLRPFMYSVFSCFERRLLFKNWPSINPFKNATLSLGTPIILDRSFKVGKGLRILIGFFFFILTSYFRRE